MVYRRVIQLSPTTKVVSLPSYWITKNKVSKGDYVNIEEKDNALVLSIASKKSDSISVDLSELNEHLLWTVIDAFYILGYSHLHLNVTSDQKKVLFKVVKYFPMFVISSETKNSVEMKSVANAIEVDFDKTLQRIRHLTTYIIDDGLDHIKSKSWDKLKDVKKIDYTLNTHVSMCFRYLSTKDMSLAIVWAQFVKLLEQFADRLCMMFEDISISKSISKEDIKNIVLIAELYTDSFKLLSKFTMASANYHDDKRKMLDESSKKSVVYIHLRELSRSLFDLHELIFQLKESDLRAR
jgi:phosphate uptake regulator